MSLGSIFSGFGLKSRILSFTTDETTMEGKKTTKQTKTWHNQSVLSILLTRGMPKVEERDNSFFLTLWQTATPVNTKCPINVATKNRETAALLSPCYPTSSTRCVSTFLSHRAPVFFSFISGNVGKSPTPWGRERRKCQCLSEWKWGISVSWWLPRWSGEGTLAGRAPRLRHRGRRLSPHQRSRWSCGCLGSWGNIGPEALTAPNTPGWMSWPGSDLGPLPAVWMWVSERAQHASSPSSSYTAHECMLRVCPYGDLPSAA